MQTQNTWVGTALILAVGTGLGVGFNALHPRSLPWIATAKPMVTLEDAAARFPQSPSGQSTENNTDPESISTSISSSGASTPSVDPRPSNPSTEPPSPPREGLTGEPAKMAIGPAPGDVTAPEGAKSPAPEGGKSPAPGASYADIPESEYPIEIPLAKAKEFFDRGGLIVLDAREADEFSDGHIQGALSAPTDERMADLEWLESMAKQPGPIMVYCGGGECELSLELGFEIARAGHRRVLVFEDGYDAWNDAGYPVAEGTLP